MEIIRPEKSHKSASKRRIRLPKKQSVVETTDAQADVRHHSPDSAGDSALRPDGLFHSNLNFSQSKIADPDHHQTSARGKLPMQEMSGRYTKTGGSVYHGSSPQTEPAKPRRFQPANLSLLRKILIANIMVILGGAIIGSYLTARLAEAGQFNSLTFAIIIVTAVSLSGAISFVILRLALRPFEELQRVLSKIHTGNPRARAALRGISDPDVRQFTGALNQMLKRLEENARIIQEDQRQLQLMTARVINAQENERKRVARELHDEASQALTAMIMGIESARQDVPAHDRMLHAKLDGLKQMAGTTLEELRKLALDLRPTMLDDLGLLPAVRWLSRTAAERAALEVKVQVDGFDETERLAPAVETCLFRITQESLTNITRHACAKHVQIKLERIASFEMSSSDGWGGVRLTVSDDGKGFRPAEAKVAAYRGGHLGLFDIEERAALLGGQVEIESRSAGDSETPSGTSIIVTVPLSGRSVEPPFGIDTGASPYTPFH